MIGEWFVDLMTCEPNFPRHADALIEEAEERFDDSEDKAYQNFLQQGEMDIRNSVEHGISAPVREPVESIFKSDEMWDAAEEAIRQVNRFH